MRAEPPCLPEAPRIDPEAWFATPPDPARLNLLCLPQAGGDTAVFHRWARPLDDSIMVAPVRLPGRGTRLMEAPFETMETLLDVLFDVTARWRRHRYAIVGTSMGAWIGHALCLRIAEAGLPLPELLVALTAGNPFAPRLLPTIDVTDRAAAIRTLAAFNPGGAHVLEYPELVDLLLPTIAADFALCRAYRPVGPHRIPVPILACAGTRDAIVRPEQVAEWRDLTSGSFELLVADDDHSLFERPPAALIDRLRDLGRGAVTTGRE